MMAIFCSWDEDIRDDFYPWKRYIKNDFYPGFDISRMRQRGVYSLLAASFLIYERWAKVAAGS